MLTYQAAVMLALGVVIAIAAGWPYLKFPDLTAALASLRLNEPAAPAVEMVATEKPNPAKMILEASLLLAADGRPEDGRAAYDLGLKCSMPRQVVLASPQPYPLGDE